jgi:phosphopantothenoylcysteine decarboxylase/phosphopantothenate--cysteine ligase
MINIMARPFRDKEIVLCVTGSIAAYKACEVASRLVEAGARVTAALSRNACEFVGALSFEAITGRPAITGMFAERANPDIEHISVAQRAHLYLIAPATANILAKAAHGIADDWISTTLLATRAPLLFAPAMNTQMYAHAATQANMALLRERGAHFVGPDSGTLACRTVGPGRLTETRCILDAAAVLLDERTDLAGRHVLITSGANHEPIDPVRFLGNRSSGRMGRALALEALCRGASVTVVTGPHDVPLPNGASVIEVETAEQMRVAVMAHLDRADVFVAAAAVADYRAAEQQTMKHKRGEGAYTLELAPNADIAAEVGQRKRPGQVSIGFAAETNDLIAHAQTKLHQKRLDFIVANAVGGIHSAIGAEVSNAHLIDAQGNVTDLLNIDKADLAARVFDAAVPLLP